MRTEYTERTEPAKHALNQIHHPCLFVHHGLFPFLDQYPKKREFVFTSLTTRLKDD